MFQSQAVGKAAQLLTCSLLLWPSPALRPSAPPELSKQQSKTSTDAQSINTAAPYEEFIRGLAFPNSFNTPNHSDLTYS